MANSMEKMDSRKRIFCCSRMEWSLIRAMIVGLFPIGLVTIKKIIASCKIDTMNLDDSG